MDYGVYPYPMKILPVHGKYYAVIKQEQPKELLYVSVHRKVTGEVVIQDSFGYGEIDKAIDWCNDEITRQNG